MCENAHTAKEQCVKNKIKGRVRSRALHPVRSFKVHFNMVTLLIEKTEKIACSVHISSCGVLK
jgi:hypothetical protein